MSQSRSKLVVVLPNSSGRRECPKAPITSSAGALCLIELIQKRLTRVEGVFQNTAGTGVDCGGGKQGGRFAFTMAEDGKSLKGLWNVCGKGEKWQWRAVRL